MDSKQYTTAALEAIEGGQYVEALTHIVAAIEAISEDIAALEFVPMVEESYAGGIDDGIFEGSQSW